jgi:hypothetical protein
MPATCAPRPLLDYEAPNRFVNDVELAREVRRYLRGLKDRSAVTLLPETDAELAACHNNKHSVAAVLLDSGLFPVEGFSVTPRGIGWSGSGRVPVLSRPYMYLSHLLRMDWRDVALLFGPETVNDMLVHQWDPYPKTAHALIMSRLKRYVERGAPAVGY